MADSSKIKKRPRPPHPPRVAIVGGGIGGLTTAALLARAGCQVTIYERNPEVGGKLGIEKEGGFEWDTGPSLITMPHVLRELWATCDAEPEDELDLLELPTTCRYRWRDGTVIDENEEFWQGTEIAKFLGYAKGLYDISAEAFLENRLEDAWRLLARPSQLAQLRHLPKIASTKTLAEKVDLMVSDPHLRQILYRFATYNGSSPYLAPSAFNIIPYVQRSFGGWYVRGGLIEVPRRLATIAKRLGVQFRTNSEVVSVMPESGRYLVSATDADGETSTQVSDVVVCNQDVLTASRGWLGQLLASQGEEVIHPRQGADISTSGFVLMLGIGREFQELDHHNILFSEDYPAEFHSMFELGEPASDPTIYIAISSRNDPSHAPEGCENWFVLVNAPPSIRSERDSWTPERRDEYGDKIIRRIGRHLGTDIRPDIRVRRTITPEDFGSRHLSFGGALYGYASHGVTSSFRRPSMEIPSLPGLHFVGGTTHPGGGIPLAMLGGRIASRRILKQHRRRG